MRVAVVFNTINKKMMSSLPLRQDAHTYLDGSLGKTAEGDK